MRKLLAILSALLLASPAFAGSSTVTGKNASGATVNWDVTTDGSLNAVPWLVICDFSAAAQCAAVKAASTAAAQTDTALVARNPDLGTIGDTAWTTGNGTAIAVLKAIANAAAGSVAAGANLIGYTSGDPCTQKTKKSVAFSTGTTGTQLFAGTASTNTYICSVSVIASAAANFSIVVGSGSSVCTGGTPLALIGSTTAANGMALPANGGLTLGNGGATVVNDVAAAAQAYNVCIGINGTATLAGSISYVQQ